ncbi:GTP cyclohydrolase I FolE [Parafrankia colletiae]|uniref:GTP cyclohydrolase 1 n=1 Tax=Parafrankia colletiae TaxID=573497 RepID=A0A1S1Q6M3_9ACTN|nr:GTP cyclohydrolase I FolE [Parafrankia colletiae]MCK9902287.1 GTP cyclohydrolase I FolE [Frankia sp. Cpl3]OHV29246.1 GTP cyclohydrolase I FolE [Parafrankia colletiae]
MSSDSDEARTVTRHDGDPAAGSVGTEHGDVLAGPGPEIGSPAGTAGATGGAGTLAEVAGRRRPKRPDLVRPFDHDRVARAVRELLIGIGEDPDREGLRKTPDRVARAYQEAVEGLGRDPAEVLTTVFDEGHDEMVLVRDIDFSSLCEHHLVVFAGKAHVAYIPNEKGQITGLSKLARLVDLYARRPQVQERLTSQVADALVDVLDPRGVMVVVEAEHLCMSMRGVRKPGATTVTSAVRGQFLSPATRSEGMSLIMRGR